MGRIYRPNLDKLTSAEKLFYHQANKEHNNKLSDWDIIFDLNIDQHLTKRDGQCDCLFIGPLGIFVVEIKGGDTIEFSNGIYRWGWKDAPEKLNESYEPPIAQAKGNMYSIRDYLFKKIPPKKINLNLVNFGYGVSFPQANLNLDKFKSDIDIEMSPKHLMDNQTISIESFIKELSLHFKEKYKGKNELKLLNPVEINYITRLIKSELKSVVSNDIDVSNSELLKLSKEQYESFDSIDFDKKFGTRLLIEGSAGTGKTVIAKYLADKLSLADKNITWISFNVPFTNSIEDYYKTNNRVSVHRYLSYLLSILKENGVYNVNVKNIKTEFTNLMNQTEEIYVPKNVYREPIELVEGMEDKDIYDSRQKLNEQEMIIIDEAQDILDDTFIIFLETIIKGGVQNGNWIICMDKDKQSGLFTEMDTDVYEELLMASNSSYSLKKNQRNAPKIMKHLSDEENFDPVECKRKRDGKVIVKDLRGYSEKIDMNKLVFDIVKKEKFVTFLSPFSRERILSDLINKDEFFDLNSNNSSDIFYFSENIITHSDPKFIYKELLNRCNFKYFYGGFSGGFHDMAVLPRFLSNKRFNDYMKIYDLWEKDKYNVILQNKLDDFIDTITLEEHDDKGHMLNYLEDMGLNFIPKKDKNYYGVNVEGIKRFKGLETPTLILDWPAYIEKDDNRGTLIYTALTRALNKVYIIKT